MNKKIVSIKLESLRRCLQRIKDKTPQSDSILSIDNDLQDIICLNLERTVQVSVDIASHVVASLDLPAPASMGECFEQLRKLGLISDDLASRLKKAVGFRNIAVHSYQEINWKVVYSIITTKLEDFVEFAKAISKAADLDT
jgi:uncharacterized protein YutE (UPF0331/DUF86 family)